MSTAAKGGVQSWSGTSMAAPHVAGVAALYKQVHGDAPSADVEKWIVDHATPGVVQGGDVGGTPNRLLYAGDL
jgi:subtilisin family serine protease